MSMSTVDFYSASPHPPLMRWVPKFTFYTEGWPGWVSLGSWLHSETVYQPKGSHPSHY